MTGTKYIGQIATVLSTLYYIGAVVRIILIGISMMNGDDEGKGRQKIRRVLMATVIVVMIDGLIVTIKNYYK